MTLSVFAFSESKPLQELLCRARRPFGGVVPLNKVVPLKVRHQKKQRPLSAVTLVIFGKINNNYLRHICD